MTVLDESKVEEVLKRLEELNSMYVEVGILSSSSGKILMIANVHEFGCSIQVTDKMRGYFLHAFGIPLRKSTTTIKIPERSFIRSSYDAKKQEIYKSEDLLHLVLEGSLSARSFYEALGETCVATIKNYLINEIKSPPNAPLTIANKKGKSNPLVDSGQLVGSIAYEIKGR